MMQDKRKTWNLAAYEIDEIKEGLEDAAKQDPAHDGLPIPDMIKTNTEAPLDELEKAVEAKSSPKFVAAFDKLTKDPLPTWAATNSVAPSQIERQRDARCP
jgi:hypothetical protein